MAIRTIWYGGLLYTGYNYYLYLQKPDIAQYDIGYNPLLYRTSSTIHSYITDGRDFLVKPPLKKVLPNEVVIPGMPRRKTLVLHLEDMMIHKSVEFGKAPELSLRPGLRQMLNELSPYYEIVIFSEYYNDYVTQILTTLDTFRKYQMVGLGHEYYAFQNGQYVKDLSILNRQKNNIVVVDLDKKHLANHQENAIILKKFEGDGEDTEFIKLKLLLRHLATVADIPKELTKFGTDPVEGYRLKVKESLSKTAKRQSRLLPF